MGNEDFCEGEGRRKKEQVERIDATHFVVQVKESPIHGRANRAILYVLAKYLNIATSRIKIVSGSSSKQKTFEIPWNV